MFCAWVAPPEVEFVGERLMTKPSGSRVRAIRRTFGAVVALEAAGPPGWPPTPGAGALVPGPDGAQAPSSTTTPTRANAGIRPLCITTLPHRSAWPNRVSVLEMLDAGKARIVERARL